MKSASRTKQPRLSLRFSVFIDLIIILAFVVLSLAYWWPIRFLPYYGDTATLVVNGAKSLIARDFQPLTLIEFQINHPTLFFVLTGFVWHIFGESLSVTHALMIPWLVLAAWSFYKLSTRYFSTEIALMGTFLLLFIPFVVNQFQLVSIHLAIAALTVTAVYLWGIGKKTWSMAVVAVSIWISWTGLLILPALGLDWYKSKKKPTIQIFLIPLAATVIWLLYHNVATGWFFIAPNHQLVLPESLQVLVTYTFFVARTIIFTNLHWLYFLPGLIISCLLLIFRVDIPSEEKRFYLISWVTFLTSLFYFSVRGNFSLDSALFLFPILLLVTILSLRHVIQKVFVLDNTWLLFGILVVIAVLSLTRWRTNPNRGAGFHPDLDHSLNYQDNIILHRQAAAFLKLNYPEAQIVGAFPEISMLTEPHHGYVDQPLNFQLCSSFTASTQETQILYLHPYHLSQIDCHQLKQQTEVVPVEEFVLNGKWIELYQIRSASESSSVEQQN